MAPEIRWAVLKAAVTSRELPSGSLGTLAYLLSMDPQTLQVQDLARALKVTRKTAKKYLEDLEIAGYLGLKRVRSGYAVELLIPPCGVQMVKPSQKDITQKPEEALHETGKIYPSLPSERVNNTLPNPETGKKDPFGKVETGKKDPSENPEGKNLPIKQGEFLLGLLEGLNNGSKPEGTDPVVS